jgi:non-lysosomal glucosylceramidase
MKRRCVFRFLLLIALLTSVCWSGEIPKAAWKRPIGLPLANAGTRKPALPTDHIDDGYWQGAPVGGFGAGTFSRTYRGDFARWHIKTGAHVYETVYANQFAMFQRSADQSQGFAQVLFTDHPPNKQLSGWNWNYPVGAGDYYALYPKSWFDYRSDKFPAHVVLEQFSPILPDNYQESSYPVAAYRWHADNPTNHAITVSVMLSWTNMVGWFRSFSHDFHDTLSQGDINDYRSETIGSAGTMKGIVFDRVRSGPVKDEWDGQFVIATLESPGVEVSYQTTFQSEGDGKDVWGPFSKDGKLSDDSEKWISSGEKLAGAIAVRFTLQPGESHEIPMVISWDLPVVEFGAGRKWNRRYTDFFGKTGTNAWAMAREGLLKGQAWSDDIDRWQAAYVNDDTKPLWYRGMLFNELYIIADAASFWGRETTADPKAPLSFAFLECFDYPFYATLDVRFYASLPLAKFWPAIDKQVLYQFADAVPRQWDDKMIWQWKSEQAQDPAFRMRKKKGAVPHDLGVPQEDPFVLVNQFSWQDTDGWKDLNSKFVLMVYRDYVLTGRSDVAFLRTTWPGVQEAIAYLKQYDHDDSGLPANEGYPDQTYDEWVVQGASAYSGSLWLGALRSAEEIGKALGDSASASRYHEMFVKAQKSYIDKLWNGEYFRYDTQSEYRDNIQADQLAGQWYADMTGLGDLVPLEMRQKALKKIFDFNVMKFAKGEMGAVNGIAPNGDIIRTNQQVQEVWTGTTLALAGFMLGEGMKDEAYRTAWGIYHVSYETKGYWFRTPEAWDISGNYRASMYMRPTSVWALEMTHPPQ